MATKNQRAQLFFFKFLTKWKRPKLKKSPQRRGVVLRLRICTPRKPNSARRPIVKARLSSKKRALAHIPGKGHTLRRHSKVLICGVGARDLPLVNYSCLRGVFDFDPKTNIRKRWSIYGCKKPEGLSTHIRRKIRKFLESNETA